MLYHELSHKIIGAAFDVHSELGCGLLEQCYHNAMYYELQSLGLPVAYQQPFTVHYKGHVVGEYYADLMVNSKIILELKSADRLVDQHMAQLINYLRIANCRVGYLLNFQPAKLEFKRIVV